MASARAQLTLDLSPLHALRSASKAKTVTLKAVRKAAQIVTKAAKQRAPKRKGSGALRASMGQKAAKGKKGATLAFAVVGARKSVVRMVKPERGTKPIKAVPAYYAHLVEDGTRPHPLKKGSKLARRGKGGDPPKDVRHPGARPRPFLKPAWAAAGPEAVAAAQQVIGAEVAKILAKG
jgi:HK97 gp10 family phage protein